jgi:hypothetical protein
MNGMQLVLTCQVKFELTWSFNTCLLTICFHAMCNIQLASTCKVRSNSIWSLECMLTFKLVSSMNAMQLASISMIKSNLFTCMFCFQFGFISEQHAISFNLPSSIRIDMISWMHVYFWLDFIHEQHAFNSNLPKLDSNWTWSLECMFNFNWILCN